MEKTRKALRNIPEFLLILAVLFYWYSTALVLNPIAIFLMLLLTFQLVTQNKFLGLLIPSVLICCCLFMLLALISEFSEFPTFNAEAKELLYVGLTYFVSTIIVSVAMFYKYLKNIIREENQLSVSAN